MLALHLGYANAYWDLNSDGYDFSSSNNFNDKNYDCYCEEYTTNYKEENEYTSIWSQQDN